MKKIYFLEKFSYGFDTTFVYRKAYETKEEAVRALHEKGYKFERNNVFISDLESPFAQYTDKTYYKEKDDEYIEDYFKIMVLEID